MQARFYAPLGRFLSNDPMDFLGSGGNPAFFNRYAYVLNDPVNKLDLTGEAAQDFGHAVGLHALHLKMKGATDEGIHMYREQ